MAGATKAAAPHVDGASLVPLLRETAGLKREAIYWHYPHYHPGGATPYSAVREANFKLIEFFEDKHVELYNLKGDIRETVDLASKLPEKAAQLRARLERWRTEVGAQLPMPNPAADPVKDAEKKGKAAAAKSTMVSHESWPVLLSPHSDCVGLEVLARVNELIRDALRNSATGIGKPEPLRGDLQGWWSRRITREHRLVYGVEAGTLVIMQSRFHYGH